MYVNLDFAIQVLVRGGICLCMFACWDSIEPIRCDVGDVYVGCGDWYVADGSFVC